MKRDYHPVSTTSRPIALLAADAGIPLDYEVVERFAGAHLSPAFAAINPSCQVPVLDDDGFVPTESTAIPGDLADRHGAAAHPRVPKARARVDERPDWLNAGLFREPGSGRTYALEVGERHLERMLDRGRSMGMEVREIADHGFIRSIYFRDPDGYVIELTARKPGHDEALGPRKNGARAKPDDRQARRRGAVHRNARS